MSASDLAEIRDRLNWKKKHGLVFILLVIGGVGSTFYFGNPPINRGGEEIYYLGIGFFLFGLFILIQAVSSGRKYQRIRDTPMSEIESLAMGEVEVSGEVVPDGGVLDSPFTDQECVAYKYKVEEFKRFGTRKYWVGIDLGGERTTFYLDDGTGKVLIDPEGSELDIMPGSDSASTQPDAEIEVDEDENPPEEVKKFVEDSDEIEASNNKRKFIESHLAPGDEVYVYGKAIQDQHGDEVVINKDRSTRLFLITDSSERGLKESMGSLWRRGPILGILVALIGYAMIVWVSVWDTEL